MRQSRKSDHLRHAIALPDGPVSSHFGDFNLLHNCLPNINLSNINLSTDIAGFSCPHPLLINAITGGAAEVTLINKQIAQIAKETHTPMAVGSQFSAIEQKELETSYKIARKINPEGIIFANLGAHATPGQALRAVDMVEAQAIQIHLNVAQEITMGEGDRTFTNYLRNIEKIVKALEVPVIVKEVGCGIAAEQANQLVSIGVRIIDSGGAGGTNFIAIEAARCNKIISSDLLSWGIPSAISLVEILTSLSGPGQAVASGGIRTPLDAVKALALGAVGVGIAAPVIKRLSKSSIEGVIDWIHNFLAEIQTFMLLTGSSTIEELSHVPIIISGFSREWLTARGINMQQYALRKRHSF